MNHLVKIIVVFVAKVEHKEYMYLHAPMETLCMDIYSPINPVQQINGCSCISYCATYVATLANF